MKVHIEVPGPPAPFRKKVMSWRSKDNRTGTHAYDEQKYAKWKDLARLAASRAMQGEPPIDGPVSFDVMVFFPIPESMSNKKRDLARMLVLRPTITPDYDNLAKACADAITQIVIRDDKFIVDARIRKYYSDRPRVEMTIETFAIPITLLTPTKTGDLFNGK